MPVLSLVIQVSCYSCCFQTLVSHGYYFKKIIITISALDEISDSFKKQPFVYNNRDNRFKELSASQICRCWGFLKNSDELFHMQIIGIHPLSSNSLLGFWSGCFFLFPNAEILNALGNHRQVNLKVLKI